MNRFFIVFVIIISSLNSVAQEAFTHNQSDYTVENKYTNEPIKINGLLDEAIWSNIKPASNFWMKFPNNTEKAKKQTEVKIAFDNKFLYFAFTCYDSVAKFTSQTLKRDKGLRGGDGVAIVIDPFNQKSNGFFFGVNCFNAQFEDLLTSNSDNDLTFSWDNKWFSATKIYADRWVAEIAIPFNILRYDPTKTTWGINFIRDDVKKNHFHTWTRMPLQFRGLDLGFLGQLKFEKAPPKQGSNISVNPYTSFSVQTETGLPTKFTPNAGVDAKVAVTNSLNLDLTINPDFSQVDVDRQVTNLSRFNVFFPERRAFFLENDDLFSNYGLPPIKPFYTRRIGNKNGVNMPILFGARLSGNLNKDLRIGLLNMQTGKKAGEAADNFTAVTFNQRVLNRSQVKGYGLNRASFLSASQLAVNPQEKYSRNAGLEFNYISKDGQWGGWFGNHISQKPKIKKDNTMLNFGGGYFGTKFSTLVDFVNLGTNYYTDMGFTERIENYDALYDTSIRIGFKQMYNENTYSYFFKKESKLNRLRVNVENFLVHTYLNKFNEFNSDNSIRLEFKSSKNIEIGYEYNKVQLLTYTKFVDDALAIPLPLNLYKFGQYYASFNSDSRKRFSYNAQVRFGEFYNANYQQYKFTFNARQQPYFTLSLNFEYNKLVFPIGFGKQTFLLIAPSIEYNFSTKLFWTTFLQYNTQANNINVNSRLQYRFRPMTDLFVVYSDNYFSDPILKNKNRALVVKFNYWLNL
jgi:hypothetical protein